MYKQDLKSISVTILIHHVGPDQRSRPSITGKETHTCTFQRHSYSITPKSTKTTRQERTPNPNLRIRVTLFLYVCLITIPRKETHPKTKQREPNTKHHCQTESRRRGEQMTSSSRGSNDYLFLLLPLSSSL